MTLEAGTLHVTVEFAKDLADRDFFGKQDPYCILTFGSQRVKSHTHARGGRNPVWNETFSFQALNDNTVSIQIYDEDVFTKDDLIGTAHISCAKAREQGHERAQVPVKVGDRQKGFIMVSMHFIPNSSHKLHSQASNQPMHSHPQSHPSQSNIAPADQPPSYPAQPSYYPPTYYTPPAPQYPPYQAPLGYPAAQYPAAQYPAAQYPATQYSAAQYPEAQYLSAQYPATQYYPAAQYPAAQHSTAQYPAAQYPAAQYPAAQHSTA